MSEIDPHWQPYERDQIKQELERALPEFKSYIEYAFKPEIVRRFFGPTEGPKIDDEGDTPSLSISGICLWYNDEPAPGSEEIRNGAKFLSKNQRWCVSFNVQTSYGTRWEPPDWDTIDVCVDQPIQVAITHLLKMLAEQIFAEAINIRDSQREHAEYLVSEMVQQHQEVSQADFKKVLLGAKIPQDIVEEVLKKQG